MSSRYPSIEFGQAGSVPDAGAPPRRRRWKLFLSVLLAACSVGVAVVYLRPPVYRASVSVLTVKPKGVDQPSADADVEHVAIQERLLTGEELLGRLAARLEGTQDAEVADRNALRSLLSVAPVPDTNLLELRAEGEDPARLQRVVNAWAKSYEGFRLEEIERSTGRTSAEIEDERRQIEGKVEAARAELAAFRASHDIVSLERGENRSLSAIKGINDSLNRAQERLIDAQSREHAVADAIARGKTVVPSEQKAEIARMRVETERAAAQLAELRTRFTDRYIATDPAYRELPAQLEEKRRALAAALELGRQTVRDEAAREVAAARASVAALQAQLATDQSRSQQFTEHFEQYAALKDRTERLEQLLAERGERLARIQVQNHQKFPPIEVVQWAALPKRPIYPDYERDLAIALAAAVLLALFVTWLVEYLRETPAAGTPPPILGVQISHGRTDEPLAAPERTRLIDHSVPSGELSYLREEHARPVTDPAAGDTGRPRELDASELGRLLQALPPTTAGLATLLLSGVAPYELPLLDTAAFDAGARRVQVPGSIPRVIPLDTDAWRRLEPLLAQEPTSRFELLAGLDLRLAAAGREAGVPDAAGITAFTLWHSYAVYLARQGIDESALIARVGRVPPEVRRSLEAVAAGAGGGAGSGVDYTHPAIARA